MRSDKWNESLEEDPGEGEWNPFLTFLSLSLRENSLTLQEGLQVLDILRILEGVRFVERDIQ